MNIFLAIPISVAIARYLMTTAQEANIETSLPASMRVRWAIVENAHITLHFFGPLSASQQTALSALLINPLQAMGPFTVSATSISLFPHHHSRLLAAMILPCESLVALHQSIAVAVAQTGLPLETRPYRPHVTLGRLIFSQNTHFSQLPLSSSSHFFAEEGWSVALNDCSWQVNSVILYASYPHQTGSHYVQLRHYSLSEPF